MRASWVIIGVVVLALVGGAYYVATNPSLMDQFKEKQVITDQKAIAKTAVGWAASPFSDDYNTMHVSGYVDNLGKKKLATVVLEINLLDSKGDRKEQVKYTVRDIDAGARKTFDAIAGNFTGGRTAQMKIIKVEAVQ